MLSSTLGILDNRDKNGEEVAYDDDASVEEEVEDKEIEDEGEDNFNEGDEIG